jgi:hypothetical protein
VTVVAEVCLNLVEGSAMLHRSNKVLHRKLSTSILPTRLEILSCWNVWKYKIPLGTVWRL